MTVGQEIFSRQQPSGQRNSFAQDTELASACRSTCDHCGGRLIEIRMKLVCGECHAICETCCEGGRG